MVLTVWIDTGTRKCYGEGMPNLTTANRLATVARSDVQETLVNYLYLTNVFDDPDYDKASALSAFDALLIEHGSLGAVLDYLTQDVA